MKFKDLERIVRECPVFFPVFEVTEVPDWASKFLNKGDKVYWDLNRNSYKVVETDMLIGLGHDSLKFVEYRRIN